MKEGTTTIATFEYDAYSRRTEKSAAGVTHNYIYDAEDIVEERLSGSTTDTIRYYHGTGIDEPLARKNSSDVVTYYLADHLGSIVQETAASGAVALEREYDAWGEQMQGATTSGYSFGGRDWEPSIGLLDLRYRWYSPSAARFVSMDPIGFRAGPNVYAYVDGNPLVYTDPFGLTKLPPSPKDLPPEWTPDPSHKDPNGSRWRHPSGDFVDFHPGKPGEPGWGGRDHWHHNGKKWHYRPGDEIPDPPAPPDPNKRFTIPEAPPWLLPAVTGGLVLATCILAPQLCVPAIACAARR